MKYLFLIPIVFVGIMAGCKKSDKMALASVSTTTASSISANSAQVGGSIGNTGGSTITKSGICWAIHTNPSISDSIVSSGATGVGSFTSTLSNLNANTAYYVRAFAINGTGTSYGSVDSFVTSKGMATVSTNAISNIAPLSAHSGGSVTNDGGASVTARGICWATSAHPTIASFKTSDSLGTGSFTDSLTDLASQTVYYVRAYATNSFGTAYGNEISFTASSANTVVDIDGNVYPYVVIGNQTWMGSNLKTAHYQNGDSITNGSTGNFEWYMTGGTPSLTGAYSFPNGDPNNNAMYGKYYNIGAIQDARQVCPIGWHVPTDGEWETLEFSEGMAISDTGALNYRGTIAAIFLAGGATGLNLQLAGYQNLSNSPTKFNVYGLYWTATIAGYDQSGNIYICYFRGFGLGGIGPIYRNKNDYSMSVRCIKN